jgi:hypothetical protein
MRWRVLALTATILIVAITAWALHAGTVDHWLAVHIGTANESSGYYAFWSGFGSDVAEFGLLGAVVTTAYQTVKKYNCHESRCWRIGNHPAAGGQFSLCYRHHPDYQGTKPTADMVARLHRDHLQRQAALREVLRPTDRERQSAGGDPANRAGAREGCADSTAPAWND